MTNYNQQAPQVGKRALWRDVEIGWAHNETEDGIEILGDDDGNPIPTSYRIPAALTSKQLIDAVEKVGQDRLDELSRTGTIEASVELLGAIIGDDTVLRIASDPTVEASAFADFVTDLIESLALHEAVPGGKADPKV